MYTNRFTLHPLLIALPLAAPLFTLADEAKTLTPEQHIERVEVVYKRSSVTSEITEDAEKLMAMPGAMGDPLRAAFALPGVVAAGGSMSAPAVRGSSPDDNIFEVDFMPAGYIFHDFGSSIFNRHLIQDFQLYSAGYGASYSNVTGAVFDVSLRNPKYQPIKTTIDLTMFNAGVFAEGQATENSAFYFSARKSTLPLFFKEGEELEDEDGELSGIIVNEAPDDHDYQGKWVWDINDNNTLSVNFTGAEDSAAAGFNERADLAQKTPEFQGDARFTKKFNSQSVIWDHYGRSLYLKAGIGVLNNNEKLSYGKRATLSDGYFEEADIQQLSFKTHASYRFNPEHRVLADFAYYDKETQYRYDTFLYVCTELDADCDLTKRERITGVQSIEHDSAVAALAHVWTPNSSWQTEIGAQFHYLDYSDESLVTPRVAVDYFVTPQSTVSFKVGRYNREQDAGDIMPQVGNPKLKPQQADHITLGFEQQLADEWSWSVETYYKTMRDLPLAIAENATDAALLYSNDVEGKAYGIDILVNKNKTTNWYGWIALSAAKSERTDLRQQVTRDYFADTPLVFNAVLQYEINELWQIGVNFTARSGQAYTPIIGVRENPDFAGRFLPVYGEPFSKRHDLYHRLDIRAERKTDWFGLDGKVIIELMNAYNQKNTASIDLDYDKVKSVQDLYIKEDEDDFGLRPSIGYSFSF
ncbi:TonB-dependent receptor plug domain-containing protein [Pseudoalteromonas fenneropenaei]|uniref:TonB-dependent receptor plug domain-containing protein n=1 Tax=Pseudoalteromonas fenneropenaei TaxID=1737459 RepID=A0ABV7CMI2_9GAMM